MTAASFPLALRCYELNLALVFHCCFLCWVSSVSCLPFTGRSTDPLLSCHSCVSGVEHKYLWICKNPKWAQAWYRLFAVQRQAGGERLLWQHHQVSSRPSQNASPPPFSLPFSFRSLFWSLLSMISSIHYFHLVMIFLLISTYTNIFYLRDFLYVDISSLNGLYLKHWVVFDLLHTCFIYSFAQRQSSLGPVNWFQYLTIIFSLLYYSCMG